MANSFLKYWLPLYLYAGIIFYLSSISIVLPETNIPFYDRWLHIVEYTVFSILAARAFRNSSKNQLRENFKIIAALLALIYGVSDELHQFFVPGRDCNIFDALADGLGGIVGVFIYGKYYSFKRHTL